MPTFSNQSNSPYLKDVLPQDECVNFHTQRNEYVSILSGDEGGNSRKKISFSESQAVRSGELEAVIN